MATAQQAIKWIAQFINRPGDNGGSYMWELAGMPQYTGSAWCGATQVACANAIGVPLTPTTAIRCIYVPYVVLDAKKAGLWRSSYHSQPGDWVVFDWLLSGRRDGLADHIGMVVENDPSKPYIKTIEGNAGSKANGQRGVDYHIRYRVDILGTVNRQGVYDGNQTPVVIVPKVQDLNTWIDLKHRKLLQKVLGVEQDGIVGPITIKALQKALGTPQDGELTAPQSQCVEALQKVIGAGVDGELGPDTGSHLESYLDNGGTFARNKPKPKPAPLPDFPLPSGHAYAMNDHTIYTHSGVRGAPDTTNIRKIQSKVGTNSDGIYGPKTKAAVVRFQKAHGLKADGEVGPKTGKALGLWS